ncbi:1,4-alpha-glucan branching protein [Streptomyces sp. NPDC098781]|uniref:maltokinase N-terminal cap-like domain-containing protein n=1 Tax=Streptomyces sp. NPDC098781 TaxID=3366097 RepID=UPI0037F4A28A
MAVIHHTTVTPTKLELLATWLPTRPWYVGAGEPRLAKAGGFRLDDPQGEVGIEFMVTTDDAGPEPVAYLVPLTYRGAPLDGAEHALVGTMEHGVLGRRWAYDGCHDPVLAAELWALIEGRAEAQAQSVTDMVDREVTRSYAGPGLPPEQVTAPVAEDSPDGTRLPAPDGTTLHVQRTLRPLPQDAPLLPEGAVGHFGGTWQLPDGTRVQGLFGALYVGA